MTETTVLLDEQFVLVPVKEYKKLLSDQNFLNALRDAGVDNWNGYDCAIDLLNDKE